MHKANFFKNLFFFTALYLLVRNRLNLDPDSNPDPNPDSDPKLITDSDPDPNLQFISGPSGFNSRSTTLLKKKEKRERLFLMAGYR